MENEKAQHREFVQTIISRLNNNSFQIKGLMITILAAFLAIYATNQKVVLLLIPCPLILVFWLLDSFYLQKERKLRGIFNDICNLTPKEERKTLEVFEIDTKRYNEPKYSFLKVMFSPSLLILYPTLITILLITYLLLNNN